MSKKFFNYVSASFTLLISQEITRTNILMQLHTEAVNTRYIPNTASILRQYCPSVLRTKCFNQNNLPFRQEVQKTEIGHLFEHILLEELCIEKLSCGYRSVAFNGRTNWNWIKEPRGLFHITIDAGFADQSHLTQALAKSVATTETVLSYLPSSQGIRSMAVKNGLSDLYSFLSV